MELIWEFPLSQKWFGNSNLINKSLLLDQDISYIKGLIFNFKFIISLFVKIMKNISYLMR